MSMLKPKIELSIDVDDYPHLKKYNEFLKNGKVMSSNNYVNMAGGLVENGVSDDVFIYFNGVAEDSPVNHKFAYGDTIKKLFLSILDNQWEYKTNIISEASRLIRLEKGEKSVGKPFYEFTLEEIEKYIKDNYREEYYKMRSNVVTANSFLSIFQIMYSNDNWKKAGEAETLKRILNIKNISNPLMTKRELKGMMQQATDFQELIAQVLVFEGVKQSSRKELNELVYIKKSDIHDDYIEITHGNNPRKIYLDKFEMKFIKMAAMQKTTTINQKYIKDDNIRRLFDLYDTEYLLRAQARTDFKNQNKGTISNNTILSRLNKFKIQYEKMYDKPNMNFRNIANSGKVNSIDKYIIDGDSEQEAFIKTLKKFGEWDFSEKPEINPTKMIGNRQRINRMKKMWEINSSIK